MDDTVEEMRKKEGSGCNVESVSSAPARGWMRAWTCGLGARAYDRGLCVCCDWDWTDEALVYLSGPVWGPEE